jgi:hypothetical protein
MTLMELLHWTAVNEDVQASGRADPDFKELAARDLDNKVSEYLAECA